MLETYTPGFRLFLSRDITTKDITSICEDLYDAFDNNTIFLPEKAQEGGIEMVSWDGKEGKQYKSMRMVFRPESKGSWYPSDMFFEDASHPVGYKTKGSHSLHGVRTFLKAEYGAPVWTKEELDIFRKVLAKYGITCQGEIADFRLAVERSREE